jgi:hypothetical protein
MKKFGYIFLIIAISSCSSFKNTKSDLQSNIKSNSIQDTSISVNPFISSLCDTLKMDFRRCVVQRAFDGDVISAKNITKNMPYFMKIEGRYMSKFRGEILFNHLINIAGKVFDCSRNHDGQFDGSNAHSTYEIFYKEMIRSVDGMIYSLYLDKLNPNNGDKLDRIEKDKCLESEYRKNYDLIKQAYEKGLIKLKDYGEE